MPKNCRKPSSGCHISTVYKQLNLKITVEHIAHIFSARQSAFHSKDNQYPCRSLDGCFQFSSFLYRETVLNPYSCQGWTPSHPIPTVYCTQCTAPATLKISTPPAPGQN